MCLVRRITARYQEFSIVFVGIIHTQQVTKVRASLFQGDTNHSEQIPALGYQCSYTQPNLGRAGTWLLATAVPRALCWSTALPCCCLRSSASALFLQAPGCLRYIPSEFHVLFEKITQNQCGRQARKTSVAK